MTHAPAPDLPIISKDVPRTPFACKTPSQFMSSMDVVY